MRGSSSRCRWPRFPDGWNGSSIGSTRHGALFRRHLMAVPARRRRGCASSRRCWRASSAPNRSSSVTPNSCPSSSATGHGSWRSRRTIRSARRSPRASTPRFSDRRENRSTRCTRGGCSTPSVSAGSDTASPSSSAAQAPGRLKRPAPKRSSASTPSSAAARRAATSSTCSVERSRASRCRAASMRIILTTRRNSSCPRAARRSASSR